jgi:hypothetical protein
MSISFKGIVTKLVIGAKDFKADILKCAEDAPAIAGDVQKDAPEVASLVELAFPGAAPIEEAALEAFEVICGAVEAAGPAAAQNGLSVSLDKAFVAKTQAVLPALKAAIAKL